MSSSQSGRMSNQHGTVIDRNWISRSNAGNQGGGSGFRKNRRGNSGHGGWTGSDSRIKRRACCGVV